MTLYEYLQQTTDWEITVWDKDYDIETYFYKTNEKDRWCRAMDNLAKLLTISRFNKDGVTVNLTEIITKKISRLKETGLFTVCEIDRIMEDIAFILAGNVSESWLEKFVEVLSEEGTVNKTDKRKWLAEVLDEALRQWNDFIEDRRDCTVDDFVNFIKEIAEMYYLEDIDVEGEGK